MRRLWGIAGTLAVGLSLSVYAAAQDAPAEVDRGAIPNWIKQLEAGKFAERQAASQKLTEAGREAIPALAEAAAGANREASSRSIEILKKHLQGPDEATRNAAREVLEKLAQNETPRIAAAATEALKPKPAPGQEQPNLAPPAIQLGGGQVQIQVFGGNAAGRRIGIQNINGVKTIDAEENGRKVKIVDDPQNGIKVEVTEKVDDKEQTKKYEAKDADELKKKHPDAHKLYEQYGKQQGGLQIQFNGGALPALPGLPMLPPGRALPLLPAPFGNRQAVQEQLEKAHKELQEAVERVKKASADAPQAGELGKAVEQLEGIRKRLGDTLEKLQDQE